MRYAMNFILIVAFAIGIPTNVLSFVVLKTKGKLERPFLMFQVGLLLLMLFEALIYFLYDIVRPAQTLAIMVLFFICRVILAALALVLYVLASRIVKLESKTLLARFSAAAVFLVAVGALSYTVTVSLVNPDYFQMVRHFDLIEALSYLILLYPIALVLFRMKRIQNSRLSKALLPFLVLGALLIPASALEDFLVSRSSGVSTVFVLPLWSLLFNGLVLYFGIRCFLFPKYGKGMEVEVDAVIRVCSRYNISEREKQVLILLVQGYSNREIGERLFISAATVRNHVHNILEKTNVGNRVGLTRLYTQR